MLIRRLRTFEMSFVKWNKNELGLMPDILIKWNLKDKKTLFFNTLNCDQFSKYLEHIFNTLIYRLK